MGTWGQIFAGIGILVVFGFMIFFIKRNRSMFTWKKFDKTMFTMGIVTLLIIVLIAVCIWMLRH